MYQLVVFFLLAIFNTIPKAASNPPLGNVVFNNGACANFNFAASQAAIYGIEDVYTCPHDRVGNIICNETFPIKPLSNITQSQLTFSDIVFFVLVGPRSATDAFLWWLDLAAPISIDIVLVADACPNSAADCADPITALKDKLKVSHPHVNTHIVRANPQDAGYNLLSCKLRTGISKIYGLFPNRKYYFKMDTDTILFPRRFLSFVNTLDSVAASDVDPIYFGTVIESGMDLLLCGQYWTAGEGNSSKGGLCYGQGGAGYGLNNVAMKMMASEALCNTTVQTVLAEDVYTASAVYRNFGRNVIHCSGFRSSELVSDSYFRTAITFHFIDKNWLNLHGKKVIEHYNRPHSLQQRLRRNSV